MKNMNGWNKRYEISSFFIPVIIMFIVLLQFGISFNGEKTILASDAFHQYVIFAQTLRQIMHGSDSLFYTFTSGLGLNFFVLIPYYLGSFLSPFVYFFDVQTMPDAIYVFTLLKFGFIGLSAYCSFHRIYPSIKPYLILSLSISYALMSFLTSQMELNSWLDVFILLPVILLGLHRLITQNKIRLYYLTLSVLFVQNYYFGYMVALFLLGLCLVNLVALETWRQRLVIFARFIAVSIAATLTSAFVLLPVYFDLSSYGEKLSSVNQLLTDQAGYLDIFTKLSIGVYDTTKFNALAMIYVGLLPLMLAVIFFNLKTVSVRLRVAYGMFLAIIIASFYLKPLDLFWQGMHEPNMFLHRYAWSFSTLIVILACEALSRQKDFTKKIIIKVTAYLTIFLSLPYLVFENYSFLKPTFLLLMVLFLLAYGTLLLIHHETNQPLLWLIGFTVFLTTLEIGINSYYQVAGIHQEWGFPSRRGYQDKLTDIDKSVKRLSIQGNEFIRTERMHPQTGNDSMKYGYNGVSQFSSVRNRLSSKLLDRLGYYSSGTNLNLRYQNNTLLMDSLLGIRYNLSEDDINKFGFKKVHSSKQIKVYQNSYSLPVAVLTEGVYKDVNLSVNTLDNQTNLLNRLTGKNYSYFQNESANLISEKQLFQNRVSAHSTATPPMVKVTYRVNVPDNRQLYVSIPNIVFSHHNAKELSIRVGNRISHYTTDNVFSFFDLGYFKQGEAVDVTLMFPNNHHITFDAPHFYSLSIDYYRSAIRILSKNKVTVTNHKNKLMSEFTAPSKSSMIFTIPYDRGWTAKLNGKKVVVGKAQGGFVKVDVPKGKGKLVLTFVPHGFKHGLIVSVIGIILFVILQKCLSQATKVKE
ncbi:YfhO family protein [Streptococcus phocae subsp. phocae]